MDENCVISIPSITTISGAVSSDICRAVGCEIISSNSLYAGLLRLGIIAPVEALIAYKDITAWHRGGAETFVSDFIISIGPFSNQSTRHIIAKAIVAICDVTTIDRIWKGRMERLREFGVETPKVFSFWDGMIFQEYISYDFQEFFHSSCTDDRQSLKEDLLNLARRVDNAGFFVTGFVQNIRTDGRKLYLVDVGEDLGHFSNSQTGHTAFKNVQRWLQQNFRKEGKYDWQQKGD